MAKVLVLEDDLLSRQLLKDVLEVLGHQVLEAGTAPEACDLLVQHDLDLCLLDAQVPGGGGVRVLSELRALNAHSLVPAIVVTALAMEGDRERLLAAGFDGYLAKPVDVRNLGGAVAGFLSRGRVAE